MAVLFINFAVCVWGVGIGRGDYRVDINSETLNTFFFNLEFIFLIFAFKVRVRVLRSLQLERPSWDKSSALSIVGIWSIVALLQNVH